MEAGCDRTLRNKQHETAFDIATRKNLNEIVAILHNTRLNKDSKKTKEKDVKQGEGLRHGYCVLLRLSTLNLANWIGEIK